MTDPADRTPEHCWWQGVVLDAAGAPDRLVVVQSDRHPDGARVELSAEALGGPLATQLVCTADYGDGRVRGLRVAPVFAPRAPDLWWAELDEPDGAPPAVNLVAFTGHGRASGDLLDRTELADVAVVTADQLGAARWYPGTGEVDQIYVSPAWRRRQVGTALLAAAATLSVARGWPRLWSDGQRTVLGEELTTARSWRQRTAALTHLAPPMTPTADLWPASSHQWGIGTTAAVAPIPR